MKICCISDTHDQHYKLEIPECDLLIHAGDLTSTGKRTQVERFSEWFSGLPQARNKVCIAGNHDFILQDHSGMMYGLPNKNYTYLEDSSTVIDGVKIYGTPWTPRFYDWAFNASRNENYPFENLPSLRQIFNIIPKDTEILICHGPPFGIMDETLEKDRTGSKEMLDIIQTLPNLKLYVCGHIHEAYGVKKIDKVTYVNASSLGRDYFTVNKPIMIEI